VDLAGISLFSLFSLLYLPFDLWRLRLSAENRSEKSLFSPNISDYINPVGRNLSRKSLRPITRFAAMNPRNQPSNTGLRTSKVAQAAVGQAGSCSHGSLVVVVSALLSAYACCLAA
jgi:hypothetical protein